MGLIDNVRNGIRGWLFSDQDNSERQKVYRTNRAYADGKQKQTLKVGVNKTDDNVTINVIGLIIDRWVSWLFGRGVDFNLPGEDDSPEQEFIDGVWDENHKSILLHKLADNGAICGTAYLKIVDTDPKHPRLIALDPAIVTIDTDPEDIETVIRYTIAYNIGNDTTVKEIHELTDGRWVATRHTRRRGQPELIEDLEWEYPEFPAVIHCQNLPESASQYGAPDLTETALKLQDSINFCASNINKANRLHAAPQLWGQRLGQAKKIDVGPDSIIDMGEGTLNSIQMSEMLGSSNFLQWLVKQLYVTTRTIDLDSLADKLGALTNFGLRVLYEDTMTKLATKRELYGEMLTEVNHRLLVIGGFTNPDPGEINWPEVIPANETEETASLQQDLNMGIVSKETVAMKRGYDYAVEQEKIAADKTSESNVGEMLIKAFNRNQTA